LLLDDFARCFDAADRVVLTDIYAASEQPIPGVNSQRLARAITAHTPGKQVDVIPRNELLAYICRIMASGDIILILGAGDITRISEGLAGEMSR
jgi:UDP-N-acetylmuramate--alanine ligase